MAGWTQHDGLAIALPVDNIDTDQLIPARFMSRSRADGYGSHLFYDLSRDGAGNPLAEFPLNRRPDATVLIVGRNFGSGSSREAAVYALADAGIRAVFAPSFGDIFAGNAANNGLLAAQISANDASRIASALGPGAATANIDLETRTLSLCGFSIGFELDEAKRVKLVKGWDDIDLTMHHAEDISTFRAARHRDAPWAWPSEVT